MPRRESDPRAVIVYLGAAIIISVGSMAACSSRQMSNILDPAQPAHAATAPARCEYKVVGAAACNVNTINALAAEGYRAVGYAGTGSTDWVLMERRR